MPEEHYGCDWGCGGTISDLRTTLEHEMSKFEGITRIEWPSVPYDSDMAQFHEAPRYRDAFEQVLENIYCD